MKEVRREKYPMLKDSPQIHAVRNVLFWKLNLEETLEELSSAQLIIELLRHEMSVRT